MKEPTHVCTSGSDVDRTEAGPLQTKNLYLMIKEITSKVMVGSNCKQLQICMHHINTQVEKQQPPFCIIDVMTPVQTCKST